MGRGGCSGQRQRLALAHIEMELRAEQSLSISHNNFTIITKISHGDDAESEDGTYKESVSFVIFVEAKSSNQKV